MSGHVTLEHCSCFLLLKKKKFAIDCQVVTKIDLKHSDEKC